jgi:hypothetical protein
LNKATGQDNLMRGLRRIVMPVLASALVMLGGTAAWAQSCGQLEAQLAAVGQGGGGGSSAAVNQKRRELDAAMGQARAAGCTGGFLSLFTRAGPRCQSILGQVNRLQAELANLSGGQGPSRSQINRQRSQILQQLGNSNCGPQYARYATARSSRGGIAALVNPPREQPSYQPPRAASYRTLCVRTCDGYYFPISNYAPRSQFQTDEQACRSLCPAADVALYYTGAGQEPEDMVSLTAGEPYDQLPNAFRYRTVYDTSCTCRTGIGTVASTRYYPSVEAALAAGGPEPQQITIQAEEARIRIPVPIPRPSPSEDPETLANLAGDFVPEPTGALPKTPERDAVADLTLTGGRNDIRVVGPVYYYALSPEDRAREASGPSPAP